MSKVAVMMSAGEASAPMSSHFGKAEWIMIADSEGGEAEFVRNEGLNGRSAANLLALHACSDVILVDIGDGAFAHLQEAGIRAWAVSAPIIGSQALQLFAARQLPCVPAVAGASHHGAGHGCCCAGRGAGHGSTRCCG